ncbi:methyltransferase [Desulfovibrio sp. JY]|nr:methyltransferase [Desulfovibrio sp. JY]
MTQESARQHFPRGLVQPSDGFRFGADALLLACFAAALPGRRVLDCGTGCGPVGLGMLLSGEDTQRTVLGLDKDPQMVAAANANADALGFSDRFAARLLDVRELRGHPDGIAPESMDLVVANPPYRHPDSGRRPPSPGRDAARFETDGGLEAFAAAAAYALVNRGSFACVHLAERLAHVVTSLAARNLEIKRILPITPRRDAPARQMLVLARKNGRPGLRLDPPLALYEGEGAETRLSQQALRYCPFLACNAGPGTSADTAE